MNLTFNILKPIDFVFDHLTDMQKFVSIHPVISKIDKLTGNNYLVHETLKFGFIAYSFTYPVIIEHNYADKTIVMRATVMKLTTIEMRYHLSTKNNLTTINETIIFKSHLPIKLIMKTIFRKQHALLFKSMEAVK